MQGVRDVIERRVNAFGVTEPLVQMIGTNRLAVDLAGIKDVNQAIQLIGETPFLEFREEKPDTMAIIEAQQNGQRLNEDPFKSTGLDGRYLKQAQVVFSSQTTSPEVSLEFNDAGKKLFAEITQRDLGKIYGSGSQASRHAS
jgi:preprotein translocase subunit SecD